MMHVVTYVERTRVVGIARVACIQTDESYDYFRDYFVTAQLFGLTSLLCNNYRVYACLFVEVLRSCCKAFQTQDIQWSPITVVSQFKMCKVVL